MELSDKKIKKIIENVRFIVSKETNERLTNSQLVRQIFGVSQITANNICDKAEINRKANTVNF